jgi:hypothetical protein
MWFEARPGEKGTASGIFTPALARRGGRYDGQMKKAEIQVSAALYGGLMLGIAGEAGRAINAPLKDFAGLPQNRSIAPGRKTACHRSHFKARRNGGQFKGVLKRLYAAFFIAATVNGFVFTGKGEIYGG